MLTIATAVRALTTEHSLRARPLVRVGPSTIAGAGLGVFANVALRMWLAFGITTSCLRPCSSRMKAV